MIDFHTHIIPFVDDGAKDLAEAIKMLYMLKSQGVKTVVATPHYNDSRIDIDGFLMLRNAAYLKLQQEIAQKGHDLPEVILGAEVFLSYEVIHNDGLSKLCIGDTNYLLVEVPSNVWFEWIYDFTDYLISQKNIKPIIAHFERYAFVNRDIDRFNNIKESDVVIQVNADAFLNFRMKKTAHRLVENGLLHIIASDTHNTTDRKPVILEAKKQIVKKYGEKKWEEICNNAREILFV
ncbi:MAG: hypothetical protein GX800_00210 [Clostridiaceae bacterium]|nr:hypothetical protein [Clostridiaceae bacterium]